MKKPSVTKSAILCFTSIVSLLILSACENTDRKTAVELESNTVVSPKKPNFVWLVSEDNSKNYLKLYNPKGASMPNIEGLAAQGLVFNNVLSNAPVCSTARTTLALGAYPARLAMEYHRPYQTISLPNGMTTVNEYLKDAGYYTTNNHKEDYNFVAPEAHWAQSAKGADWHGRKAGQPFFHMQSWKETHEHKLHFPMSDVQDRPTKNDPAKVDLAPIYPDTELFRYTHARYLDQHEIVDVEIGKVIKQLTDEGLLEDTFIFYFGDHGGVMPGSKGYAFERGLNPPLVVRVPENFRHLVHEDLQAKSTTWVDGFVNFIDFAPTLLKLAGIEAMPGHDGQSFLAKKLSLTELNKRDTNFAFADRFDEKYDMVRTLRKGKYKYMRHYLPFNPDSLFASYRYKQAAFRQWREMFDNGELTSVQAAFFETKPVEALYNLETDEFETKNLAHAAEYQSVLQSMRAELKNKLQTLPDLGFYPEYYLVDEAKDDPIKFGAKNKSEIAKLNEIADLQLQDFDSVKYKIKASLTSENEWIRYWGLNVALAFGQQAKMLKPIISQMKYMDPNDLNRARAVQYLALFDDQPAKQAIEKIIAGNTNTVQILAILNIATQLHDVVGENFEIPFRKSWKKPAKGTVDSPDTWRQKSIYNWFSARVDYLKK
ncbi:sulfatase [Psychrosphaera sp. B3R10]|uniref:sulfatase family protein n=1 Tax=unclassified Psychrosphaera TaxID=2641570 RepID=UPI001C084BDB|nr:MULTISPECIES: sulfatase [unclassified Psychrosphaera]MBU2881739.1 sulfatase [Psychrosphaera sp. I2R16]MBU2990076.1 sulfatase [Psychrosphaera sp. B3R10]